MVRSPLLYRLSYKVRREQAVETEDVKVTAMNMYKEGLHFCKHFFKAIVCKNVILPCTCTCSLP